MGTCLSNGDPCETYPKTIAHANGLPIEKVFKLKKKIGGGSFGTVWLGHRIGYEKYKFAIKKINKKEVGKELELLRREIDILREVDHPNIIKYHDIYEDNNHIFIVMQYCSGGELFTKIISEGRLHESEARVFMNKMVMAVNHLHSLQIVHRDLKTENFLFDSKCATKELKLVDFGLSNKFGNKLEKLHSRVGTIYYVAPEVLKGNYDSKCDMWSLGVLMYVMLSGDLPFYDEKLAEVYKKLNNGEYHFSKPCWNEVSVTAKNLINGLLTVDPTQRLSAKDALKHEWFALLPQKKLSMTESIFESFKIYKNQNLFQKEALRLMVKHVPEEKLQMIKELFISLDKTGTGFVSIEDVALAMHRVESMEEEEIKSMITNMDVYKTGVINYSEFISAAMNAKTDMLEEALWLTFKQLDIDNKGLITEESLKRSIASIGKYFTSDQIQNILDTLNSAGESITFENFKELVLGKFKPI
jgi:calcium-dependent protein kinase